MSLKLLRTFAVAITIVACSAAGEAMAVTLAVVRSGADGWILIDRATIDSRSHSPLRQAATVTVQRQLVGQQPGYVRTLNDYDCGARRIHWRSFAVYSRLGARILSKDNPQAGDWAPVEPRTDEDVALRIVCQGGGGEAVITASSLGAIVISIMQSWDQAPAQPPGAISPAAPSRPAR